MIPLRRLPILLALLLLPAGSAPAARLGGGAARVVVKGTSTLHDWHVESSELSGALDVADAFLAAPGEELLAAAAPSVEIAVRARSLRSESARMDKVMYAALQADRHADIRYRLLSARLAAPAAAWPLELATRGELTIAGSTREVEMKVAVEKLDGALRMRGEVPLKMTDFGIQPPTALLGTVRSGDAITVSFEWRAEPPVE